MPIEESFLLLLALAGVWFWLDTLKAREAGVQAARAACDEEGWQFLDESVVGRGVRFARDDEGRLRLRRLYAFEYSESGCERRPGTVTLLGQQVEWLSIRHAPRPGERDIGPLADEAPPSDAPSSVSARIIPLRPLSGARTKDHHAPQDVHH